MSDCTEMRAPVQGNGHACLESGVKKEFPVPFRSEDRRINTVGLLRAELSHSGPDLLQRCQLRTLVANNASLANMFAARFKLRLHQHYDLTSLIYTKSREVTAGRISVAEMNETSMAMKS